jgi:hypothetical protein
MTTDRSRPKPSIRIWRCLCDYLFWSKKKSETEECKKEKIVSVMIEANDDMDGDEQLLVESFLRRTTAFQY